MVKHIKQVVKDFHTFKIDKSEKIMKELFRAGKEAKIAPPKRFIWTDPLRYFFVDFYDTLILFC